MKEKPTSKPSIQARFSPGYAARRQARQRKRLVNLCIALSLCCLLLLGGIGVQYHYLSQRWPQPSAAQGSLPGEEASLPLANAARPAGEDAPAQEEPVQEQPTQEEQTPEKPVQAEPVQEAPVPEEPAREAPVPEEPAREEQAPEKPVQAEPAQEAQPQEQPAQEEQPPAQPEAVQGSVIYLTFDDGPSGAVTGQVLDTLRDNGISATFFILDYGQEDLPLLRRMVEEGHTIGIHAYDHDYQACYSTDTAYLQGVERLRDKLRQDLGYEAFCVRFPGGSSNTVSAKYNQGVMTRLAARLEELGLAYFDWNVDSADASGNRIPAATLVENTLQGLKQGRGNVVLMHDSNTKATTAEALPDIIAYGKEQGYQFSAIRRDTPPVHHPISN